MSTRRQDFYEALFSEMTERGASFPPSIDSFWLSRMTLNLSRAMRAGTHIAEFEADLEYDRIHGGEYDE